ncbi:MAG: hypothetical protein R2860_05640 [Desulfobacterales bacterium]
MKSPLHSDALKAGADSGATGENAIYIKGKESRRDCRSHCRHMGQMP